MLTATATDAAVSATLSHKALAEAVDSERSDFAIECSDLRIESSIAKS